jgi:hypothetical protein
MYIYVLSHNLLHNGLSPPQLTKVSLYALGAIT